MKKNADSVAVEEVETKAAPSRWKSLVDVEPKRVEWVWGGLIPRGKLTLIVGEPGVGKSFVVTQAAALCTAARTVPILVDEERNCISQHVETAISPASVLLFCSEDGLRWRMRLDRC